MGQAKISQKHIGKIISSREQICNRHQLLNVLSIKHEQSDYQCLGSQITEIALH